MKRFFYIITIIYYAFAWQGMFFDILPFEANISAGVVGLLVVGDTPENAELSNLVYIIGWSIYFLTLIIFSLVEFYVVYLFLYMYHYFYLKTLLLMLDTLLHP